MTAAQVIDQLKALPSHERVKVRDWLDEHDDESTELLSAIDAGLRSLEESGSRPVAREDLADKVRRWAGGQNVVDS